MRREIDRSRKVILIIQSCFCVCFLAMHASMLASYRSLHRATHLDLTLLGLGAASRTPPCGVCVAQKKETKRKRLGQHRDTSPIVMAMVGNFFLKTNLMVIDF